MSCLFCKFAIGELPKEFVYEDADIIVFPDIRPIKPVHLLIMPKVHITDFQDLTNDSLLSKIRKVIQQMVKEKKLEHAGYRILINAGGAQAIDHLHFHLLGPMGKAAEI
jgi:histidine triad (HIT) family protein